MSKKVKSSSFIKKVLHKNDKNTDRYDLFDDLEEKIIEQTIKQFGLKDNDKNKNIYAPKFFDYEKMKSEILDSKFHIHDEKAIRAKNVLEKINSELSQLNEEAQASSSSYKTSEANHSESKKSKKHHLSKKGRWTRKLYNLKDSIKNKKFKSNRLKKLAIRGAVTLFAIGGVAFSTSHFEKVRDFFGKNNEKKYETEFTSFDKDKADDMFIYETETENETETEFATEKSSEIETEKKTKNKNQFKAETEKQTEKPSETEIKEQTEKISETEMKEQTEKVIETETENQSKLQAETKKSINKNAIKQFKKEATQAYMDKLVIGEKPAKNLFKGQIFTADPEGEETENPGHFDRFKNYEVGKIYVITNEDWYPVTVEGKSLPEALSEYPDYIDYSVLFVDRDTGNNLGYVTQSKLETIIKNKVNSIVKKSKKAQKANPENSETEKSNQIANQDYER